jgi:NAD(P)-dependent dehydrogenase (short-subunit alcohol dehydrogenase family)
MAGRVYWITGASSGIGRDLALTLARQGHQVAVTARRQADLEALAAEAPVGRVLPFAGDVMDAAAMADIVARIEAGAGPIDVAVLNAGIYLPVRAETFEVGLVRKTFDVNVMGVVHGLVPLMERMIARRSGRIAINASVAGYGGLPNSAAYGATKAALINMAASLKFDLDRYGVTIQVINPGFVDTPATAKNPFPMPFLIKPEVATARIVAGLDSDRFEITFPRRFALILKTINALPYRWYFGLVRRATGWTKPPPARP